MQSNKFPRLAELKKNLKKILKKYDLIQDIIIFGSFVKGRSEPKDLDLAFLVKNKDLKIISEIKEEINIEKVHLELIKSDELYTSTIFMSLINEGYSIKHEKFLRDIMHIAPMRLYSYDLKHLDKSKKPFLDFLYIKL